VLAPVLAICTPWITWRRWISQSSTAGEMIANTGYSIPASRTTSLCWIWRVWFGSVYNTLGWSRKSMFL
jgi:hypothetical protein